MFSFWICEQIILGKLLQVFFLKKNWRREMASESPQVLAKKVVYIKL